MLQMQDTGATCSMFDACHRFKSQTADGVFDFFKTNFERHFSASSAPFPMFAHAGWMMHHAYLYRKEGSLVDGLFFKPLSQNNEWTKDKIKLINKANLKSSLHLP